MIWSIELGSRQRVVRLELEGQLTAVLNQEVLHRMEEFFCEARAILVIDASRLTECHPGVRATWVEQVRPYRSHIEALVVSVDPAANPLFKASMMAFATQLQLKYQFRAGPVTQPNPELRRELNERFQLLAA